MRPPPAALIETLGLTERTDIQYMNGTGCDNCSSTGYRGRVALYEMMVIHDRTREAIMEGYNSTQLKQLAMEQKMITLRMAGVTRRAVLDWLVRPLGIEYAVEPDGVRLGGGSAAAMSMNGAATAAGGDAAAMVRAMRSNSFVGQVTIKSHDGTSYAFFIRENDLPPEVNQMRRDKIEDAVNELRRILFTEQDEN